jgi:hypothetical protein
VTTSGSGTQEPGPSCESLYNGKIHGGEHMQIFPLSNWTDVDIWRYLGREQVEIPSICFSHQRRVFERDGTESEFNVAGRDRHGTHRDAAPSFKHYDGSSSTSSGSLASRLRPAWPSSQRQPLRPSSCRITPQPQRRRHDLDRDAAARESIRVFA